MNRQWLDGMWDHMRQKYGIYLRVLDAIPADQFHQNPIADMRTPAQLVVHTSGSILRDIAEGVASGTIGADEGGEDTVASGLTTKDDVIAFARDCWARADAAIAKVGDEQLSGGVENPWGMQLNGTFAMVILNEELLHHRGQLFAYVRACGAEPPFLWGFGDNPEGFRPG
ncbi:MAG: DinB family protein [Gemmatimonadetes bacterium]|nr:DinB family protein [Gemmatimonadota bacterium]MBT8404931.1 DinB family protein [Gemmatimonadota bacterium]NNF38278.1 DinB family protein [Gemmatimonadota bacterium]NNK63753.1 DinB family protein [Gemmatimonadota bacterium]